MHFSLRSFASSNTTVLCVFFFCSVHSGVRLICAVRVKVVVCPTSFPSTWSSGWAQFSREKFPNIVSAPHCLPTTWLLLSHFIWLSIRILFVWVLNANLSASMVNQHLQDSQASSRVTMNRNEHHIPKNTRTMRTTKFQIIKYAQPPEISRFSVAKFFSDIFFQIRIVYANRWFIVIGLHSTALCCMCTKHIRTLPPYLIYITLDYCECVMVHSMWETRVHAHLLVGGFFFNFFLLIPHKSTCSVFINAIGGRSLTIFDIRTFYAYMPDSWRVCVDSVCMCAWVLLYVPFEIGACQCCTQHCAMYTIYI